MANANTPTAQMLDDAGISGPMRVLDVGCAMGLLTREIAARVGPEGFVVGIDLEPERLKMAQAEAAAEGGAPIEYAVADLTQPLPDLGTFDAIIGRRVLMYLSDVQPALQQLAALLRPGGIMAWHEHSGVDRPYSVGPLPGHERLADMLWDTIEHEGGRRTTALELPKILRQCGLEPVPFAPKPSPLPMMQKAAPDLWPA